MGNYNSKNKKLDYLIFQDNWNRSPSLSSSGLSVAWKNLTVTSRIGQPGFFKKAKTKYKDIIRDGKCNIKAERDKNSFCYCFFSEAYV